MPRLVFISDTHTRHDIVPVDGDILIHCGDLTFRGSVAEIAKEAQWLKAIRIGGGFKHAVLVAGNHDWLAERDPAMMRNLIEEAGWIYLDHQPAEVMGLKFFGSGYSPEFCNWALAYKRGAQAKAKWSVIPDDTQVLVTHGPPHGRLDIVHEADENDYSTAWGGSVRYIKKHVGCAALRDRIATLEHLKVHAFGHIHVHGGQQIVGADGVTYVNASSCDESYHAVNASQVVDL